MAFVPNSQWEYEWSDAVAYIDSTGNNEFTGLLLPTPRNCFRDSSNPVESFIWYHLAPAIGFQISRNGNKIKIISLPVTGTSSSGVPYNGYPYSDGWTPKISFLYKNSNDDYITIASFETESDYNGSAKESAEITGYESVDIYVTCAANECGLHNFYNHLATIKLHTHINKPNSPKIVRSTAKTITVSADTEDGIYSNADSTWHNTNTYKYTGLTKGTKYTFKCRSNCSNCPDGKVFESNVITAKTWNITGEYINSSTTSIKIKATHIPGDGNRNDSDNIVYELYTSKSTSGELVATKTASNGTTITFTGLTHGETYYCYAYTEDIPDNNCWITSHTHISNPDLPKIIFSTAKTITVSADTEDGIYSNADSTWHNSIGYTYTELTPGKSYTFKCRLNCPNCPDDNIYESAVLTAKTWNITGEYLGSGAKCITFKATHIPGDGNRNDSDNIVYELYTSKSTSGELVATKTASNGIPVTFTGLNSAKSYYCYAYSKNITDNNCWLSGSTKVETVVENVYGNTSATTLRAAIGWSPGNASSVSCLITCNGTSANTGNGLYAGFTGLTPGTTYTVSWLLRSNYSYAYNYSIVENEEIITKQGIKEEIIETTGSRTYTTRKASFGFPINITSKIIQFKCSSNNPNDTLMEQKISSSSGWTSNESDTYLTYNNLDHDTSYTIYCRISECYAFDSSGEKTSINDSEISMDVSTKKLSLAVSIKEEHQNSLITLWQAYVDGAMTDEDSIDGEKFRFTYTDTMAIKNDQYQHTEVIERIDGTTTGNYQTDKKIYSNNLTWYYCEYIVSASITDGHNIVANAIVCHTSAPLIWIYSGGQWHRYMPYIYTNNKWVPAIAHIYKDNNFIELEGE